MKQIKRSPITNHPKKLDMFAYLKESKTAINIIMILFGIGILLGLSGAIYLQDILSPLLKTIAQKTADLSAPELMLFIFTNNSLTSFLGLLYGIFAGIFPIFAALFNGILVGYVISLTIGVVSIYELWRLFPHGIFELPAVFISLGVGLNLGISIIFNFFKKFKKNNIMKFFGIFSAFLGLISLSIFQLALNVLSNKSHIFTQSVLTAIASVLFIMGIILLLPFIVIFFAMNKELREANIKHLAVAIKIFFLIVIPLLIIAAIIEGLLITII